MHAQDVGPEHAQLLLPLVCTAVLLQAVGDARTEGVWCVLHRHTLGLPEGDLPAQGGEGHLEAGGQLLGCPVSSLLELVDDSCMEWETLSG